ncbi:SGF29 tudor-like domain, partial [Striga asiatica]
MSSADIVAGILDNSKEVDRLRKELDELQRWLKNLMLYTQAKELSETEASVATQLLGQLDALLLTGTPGQHRRKIEGGEQKKKRIKGDPDVLRLSPSTRSHLESLANMKGEQVAARVSQEDAGRDEWFVVKVINFDKEAREFEVLDEEPGDDEEGGGQRKYKLPMSHIIPFPKRTDLSSVQDFPPGKHVLAVYPETTALYKATVVQARKLILGSIHVNVDCSCLRKICPVLHNFILENFAQLLNNIVWVLETANVINRPWRRT